MAISQGSWSPTSGMRENWLVQIEDSSGSNTKYYSFFDQTVASQNYLGKILNNPSIRESIDLFTSKSNLSNVTIEIDNTDNQAEDLVFGTNYYINRDVKIYSNLQSGSPANFDNIPLIYQGRLESVTHNDESLTLSIIAKRPWDNVKVPDAYSTAKTLGSLVYGDYTGNSGLDFSSNYTNNNYHPAPLDSLEEYADQIGTSSLSNINAAEYSKKYDAFLPYVAPDTSTTTSGGIQTFTVPNDFARNYFDQAESVSNTNTVNVSNKDNSVDKNLTTYATMTAVGTGTFSATETFTYTLNSTHEISSVAAKYKVQTSSGVTDRNVIVTITADGKNTQATHTSTTTDQTISVSSIASGTTSATLSFQFNHNTIGTEAYSFEVRLYELYVSYFVYGDEQEIVYSATDGLNRSYSSGTATKVHEFHRDLFYRFLGVTDSPIGWSDLDTDRSSWTGRYWTLEQKPIKQLLDKMAYEGGFCYTYSANGTLKYIYVKNSYSSADHTLDKNDLSGISIDHTPINDLITDITVNYDAHPAKKGTYRNQATASESTIRSNYNIASDEAKLQVNLDALVGGIGSDLTPTTPNAGFIDYYGNLLSEPRVIINTKVENPALFTMELGDICTLSNMLPAKAFNKSYSGLYFMVTSISRSSGKFQIELTEVS